MIDMIKTLEMESSIPEKALADVKTISEATSNLRNPDGIETDDESIQFIWERDEKTFVLTFPGNGKVIGTMSPGSKDYMPWSIDATKPEELKKLLEDEELLKIVFKPSLIANFTFTKTPIQMSEIEDVLGLNTFRWYNTHARLGCGLPNILQQLHRSSTRGLFWKDVEIYIE